MSEAWDLLITEMIRQMIREFLAHPAELLTFRKLSHRIASDADVLHAIAEQRPDLFIITDNDRFVKLFPEAVEKIVEVGVDLPPIFSPGIMRLSPGLGSLTQPS